MNPAARRFSVLLPLLSATLCFRAAAADPSDRKFDLRADEFDKAILEYSQQSGVGVLYSSTTEIRALQTHAVKGTMPASEALAKMLEGTHLIIEFESPHSAVVHFPALASGTSSGKDGGQRSEPTSTGHAKTSKQFVLPETSDVTVTGSHIPGMQSITAPLTTVTPQDVPQSFAGLDNMLWNLPLMSRNGPREDYATAANYQRGSCFNLLGLGIDGTLVLVDGVRQPTSGFDGDCVDTTMISLAAVDHIDLLPNSASSVYGSDAVAGVVNIVTKSAASGSETQYRQAFTSGRHETVLSQSWGDHFDATNWLVTYEYSDATSLSAQDRAYAANANKSRYGGGDYRSIYSSPGNLVNSSTYQTEGGINATGGLSNTLTLENQYAQYDLFPTRHMNALTARLEEDFEDAGKLTFEARGSARDVTERQLPVEQYITIPQTNPFYHSASGGTAVVAYSFLSSLGPMVYGADSSLIASVLGYRLRLGESTTLRISQSYGQDTMHASIKNEVNQGALDSALSDSNRATAYNIFGDTNVNTLNTIRLTDLLKATSTAASTSVTLDSAFSSWRPGAIHAALGAEYRLEGLEHQEPNTARDGTVHGAYQRDVESVFGEMQVPLIGASELSPSPRAQMTLSGRVDRYSDAGSAVTPGLHFYALPLHFVKLRATADLSYRAPTLDDLHDTAQNVSALTTLPDTSSPTGVATVLAIEGSNPQLQPARAKSWTVGVDVAPPVIPGLTVSVTGYVIDWHDRIIQPAANDPYNVLNPGSGWSSIVTTDPSAAEIAAVCHRPDYMGSVSSCLASSPAAIVDYRLKNAEADRITGVNVDLRQDSPTAYGDFSARLLTAYLGQYYQRLGGTGATPQVGKVGYPQRMRARATLTWSQRSNGTGFRVIAGANYTGGYANSTSTRRPRVSSLTTFDAEIRYQAPASQGWMDGLTSSLGMINMANRPPPFVDDQYGYDVANEQPLGRVITVRVEKRW